MKWFDLNPILSSLTWAVIDAAATRHYMSGQSDDSALDQLRHVLAAWAPEDSADLESIISLRKLETQVPRTEP